MTKIVSTPNCGNSPKMEFLKEFNIAFAKGDVAFLQKCVTEDIVWNIIGDKKIEGQQQFIIELEKIREEEISELILHQIMSHGKEGAVNGTITTENNQKYAFSDFYIFKGAKGAKIKFITSYVIKV